jgi:DNA-binding LacI/PurR family transcriptional regulator
MNTEQPTIKEIARRLGIAPSTVSRALHDHPRIGLRTRERVQEMARALRYVPSATAQNLRQGRTSIIGVVLPEIRENFFSTAITGIEDLAFTQGYTVALYQSHDRADREQHLLRALTNHRVDGVILSVAKETETFEHVEALLHHRIPLVLFDRIPPGIETHRVSCDIERGAYAATRLLLQRGFRRLALLNGPPALDASAERDRGYHRALAEAGLPYDPAYVRAVDLTAEDSRAQMRSLLALPAPPDAVVAFNDYVALDAMQVARAQGYRLNEELAFVSFANLPQNAYLEHPPLASVEQHPYQLGYASAQILLDVLAGAEPPATFRRVVMEPELVVRGGGSE